MEDGATGKVAFVTGASYGIGAAAALALARDGYDVAVSATRLENLAGTLQALKPTGRRVKAVALDITSQTSIEEAYAGVIAALGRVDVLVNNAGVNLRRAALDITREEWDAVMAANVTGTFFMTQRMGRHLLEGGRGGRVISIASTHAVLGAPERSAYGISKAAIAHMTRMLAVEWAPHRILVNAVAPGRVDTPSPSRAASAANAQYMQAMIAKIPLRRLAGAEEVAAAVAYLAGPHASYITGQTLLLDGGLTAY
jgi:NAD(P)-dependent dehydrogenase (short-subunit alcohol dehydrogenase family)